MLFCNLQPKAFLPDRVIEQGFEPSSLGPEPMFLISALLYIFVYLNHLEQRSLHIHTTFAVLLRKKEKLTDLPVKFSPYVQNPTV